MGLLKLIVFKLFFIVILIIGVFSYNLIVVYKHMKDWLWKRVGKYSLRPDPSP